MGWYLRFSYRDVEELRAERGLRANHVTVGKRWKRIWLKICERTGILPPVALRIGSTPWIRWEALWKGQELPFDRNRYRVTNRCPAGVEPHQEAFRGRTLGFPPPDPMQDWFMRLSLDFQRLAENGLHVWDEVTMKKT